MNHFSNAAKARREEEKKPENVKGGFKGVCNISACDTIPALWWNTVMQKHYCKSHAKRINESAVTTKYSDGTMMKAFIYLDERIVDKIKEEQAKCEACHGAESETCLDCKMIRFDCEEYGEVL